MLLEKIENETVLNYNVLFTIIEAINENINKNKQIIEFVSEVRNLNVKSLDIHIEVLLELKLIKKVNEHLYVTQLGKNVLNKKIDFAVILLDALIKSKELYEFINFENMQILDSKIYFLNSDIKIKYVALRNLMYEIEVLESSNKSLNLIKINNRYLQYFQKNKSMTLSELEKILELEKKQGAIAEQFVLKYEQNRLKDFSDNIKIISSENTSAGYDIVSYESQTNTEKIFIEVKSYANERRIYLTRNEMTVASCLENQYYLYLI